MGTIQGAIGNDGSEVPSNSKNSRRSRCKEVHAVGWENRAMPLEKRYLNVSDQIVRLPYQGTSQDPDVCVRGVGMGWGDRWSILTSMGKAYACADDRCCNRQEEDDYLWSLQQLASWTGRRAGGVQSNSMHKVWHTHTYNKKKKKGKKEEALNSGEGEEESRHTLSVIAELFMKNRKIIFIRFLIGNGFSDAVPTPHDWNKITGNTREYSINGQSTQHYCF